MIIDLGIPGLTGPREVGRGGFSVVYRAWQADFDRYVAVKVLTQAVDDETLRAFKREARSMGRLSEHPHIVNVYLAGETDDGHPYLMMSYLERGSLVDVIQRTGALAVGDAISVAIKMSGALESAHRCGITHRDIKPANVLISTFDEPFLTDFGIARMSHATHPSQAAHAYTLLYASPEVLTGARGTPVGDIYSLAAATYESTENRVEHEAVLEVVRLVGDEVEGIDERLRLDHLTIVEGPAVGHSDPEDGLIIGVDVGGESGSVRQAEGSGENARWPSRRGQSASGSLKVTSNVCGSINRVPARPAPSCRPNAGAPRDCSIAAGLGVGR